MNIHSRENYRFRKDLMNDRADEEGIILNPFEEYLHLISEVDKPAKQSKDNFETYSIEVNINSGLFQ